MSHQSTNAPEISSLSLRFSRNLRITNYGIPSGACCNREYSWCSSRRANYLPLELLELILAYLPALKIMELKRVCQTWRRLLESAKFKERWMMVRGGCSHETLDLWLMKSSKGPSIAYIPVFEQHYSFLPLILSPVVLKSPPTAIENLLKKSSFLGVDGPRMVFESASTGSASLYRTRSISLCSFNTLTGQMSDLPVLRLEPTHRILQRSLPTVIVIDGNQQEYCVVVETCMDASYIDAGFAQERYPFYALRIYTSTTNTWTMYPDCYARIDNSVDIFSRHFYQYDHGNNNLYLWTPEQQWNRVHVPFSNTNNSHTGTTETNAFKVVKCQSNVLMVTSMVRREEHSIQQGFIVWKLTARQGPENNSFVRNVSWSEISRTPADLYLKGFKEESFLRPTFIVDGGRICIMNSSDEYIPMIIYDVEHDSWYHGPELLKNMQALLAMKVSFTVPVKEEEESIPHAQTEVMDTVHGCLN